MTPVTAMAAQDVAWDLTDLLDESDVDTLLDRASLLADEILEARGTVVSLDTDGLRRLMDQLAALYDLIGRASSYTGLQFSVDTLNPEIANVMQHVQERSTAITTPLVFFELEWCALDDAQVAAHLEEERLAQYRFHLESLRRLAPHQLGEAEERLDAEKANTGRLAWARLFNELMGAISCELTDGEATQTVGLDPALARLFAADRSVRQAAHSAVTAALQPGLRTRAFIYNTLMADRAIDDRFRHFDTWISAWNLSNHASDASVRALVAAVRNRYDIPQSWYRLKSEILGHRLADYDRYAAITTSDQELSWGEATTIALDAYRSFSPELGKVVGEFLEQRWIDVPPRAGKRPGAFCSYTVPSHHPYLFLNWTNRIDDLLTLAHELGHGIHGYLARSQGVFHQATPLTVAETASVFGETLTFNRLLEQTTDPATRLTLLARQLEGGIATVFRQTAMHRFEDEAHNARRREGELSTERLGELWLATQGEMMGDTVELTPGYASWWSYIPHFINSAGYVYAYAYGQLLALSVYGRYREVGPSFVPRYLDMLAAGGSRSPEDLAAMVGCDLTDPGFWDGGLTIIAEQLAAAQVAARAAGRI